MTKRPEPLNPAERELARRIVRLEATVADVEAATGSSWDAFVRRMQWSDMAMPPLPWEIAYAGEPLSAKWLPDGWKWRGSEDGTRWLCEPVGAGFGGSWPIGPDVERRGDGTWAWRIWETSRECWAPGSSRRLLAVGTAPDRDTAVIAAEARAAEVLRERLVVCRAAREPHATVAGTGVAVRDLFDALAAQPATAEVARRLGVEPDQLRAVLRLAAREADARAPDPELIPWRRRGFE